MGMANDRSEPGQAIEIAQVTNPTLISAAMRRVDFYIEMARSFAQLRGHDREAIRQVLAAERIAPQQVHSSRRVEETVKTLLVQAKREAHGTALRGLYARMGLA
jgi:hypothetical protein